MAILNTFDGVKGEAGAYPTPVPTGAGFDVSNRLQTGGKGTWAFKYGLNAPDQHTWRGNTRENLAATIEKGGQKSCSHGLVLRGGQCVPDKAETVCKPGWVKQGAICVKGPTEFQSAYGPGGPEAAPAVDGAGAEPQNVAPAAGIVTRDLLRYYQEFMGGRRERQEGESAGPPETANSLLFWLATLLILSALLAPAAIAMTRRGAR